MRSPLLAAAALTIASTGAAQIADNSFLMEEAYNQERGVVQHISALLWDRAGGAWLYTFTQEWPLWGQTHQASYTVPVQRTGGAGSATRFGDVALNYRYQLLSGTKLSVSPRLSLLLPTGDEAAGTGTGEAGVQVNLPASLTLSPRLVTHWNAGVTADAGTVYNLGASAIWLFRPTINLMLETVWSGAPGETGAWLVNPAIRWAHNFKSGLQIVPGVGYAAGVGPSKGDDAFFIYLSFEHPFRHGAH